MRRAAALIITPLLAAAAVAGCSSSSSSSSSAAASDSYKSVTATGTFGKAPTVKIPSVTGTGALYTKTLIQGTGAKLSTAQGVIANYVLYDWSGKTSKLLGSSYTSGGPSPLVGPFIPGLQTALVGQKMGSRVLAVIPPKDAFGSAGNSSAGIKGTDTLVFVVDMVSSFGTTSVPGTQTANGGGALPTVTPAAAGSKAGPKITVPKTAAPKSLQVKDLIKGTGPVVKTGQQVVVQYTGVLWKNGQEFDSSWDKGGQPATFQIGKGQVIPGWDKGIVGQTVGSRVLLVVPPADGYGKAGNSTGTVKITGTDTLVFVVDILTAV